MDSNCLIVVAVHEGRNIEAPDGHSFDDQQGDKKLVAFLEARFNGEVLVSDPIELTSTSPQFNTELVSFIDSTTYCRSCVWAIF